MAQNNSRSSGAQSSQQTGAQSSQQQWQDYSISANAASASGHSYENSEPSNAGGCCPVCFRSKETCICTDPRGQGKSMDGPTIPARYAPDHRSREPLSPWETGLVFPAWDLALDELNPKAAPFTPTKATSTSRQANGRGRAVDILHCSPRTSSTPWLVPSTEQEYYCRGSQGLGYDLPCDPKYRYPSEPRSVPLEARWASTRPEKPKPKPEPPNAPIIPFAPLARQASSARPEKPKPEPPNAPIIPFAPLARTLSRQPPTIILGDGSSVPTWPEIIQIPEHEYFRPHPDCFHGTVPKGYSEDREESAYFVPWFENESISSKPPQFPGNPGPPPAPPRPAPEPAPTTPEPSPPGSPPHELEGSPSGMQNASQPGVFTALRSCPGLWDGDGDDDDDDDDETMTTQTGSSTNKHMLYSTRLTLSSPEGARDLNAFVTDEDAVDVQEGSPDSSMASEFSWNIPGNLDPTHGWQIEHATMPLYGLTDDAREELRSSLSGAAKTTDVRMLQFLSQGKAMDDPDSNNNNFIKAIMLSKQKRESDGNEYNMRARQRSRTDSTVQASGIKEEGASSSLLPTAKSENPASSTHSAPDKDPEFEAQFRVVFYQTSAEPNSYLTDSSPPSPYFQFKQKLRASMPFQRFRESTKSQVIGLATDEGIPQQYRDCLRKANVIRYWITPRAHCLDDRDLVHFWILRRGLEEWVVREASVKTSVDITDQNARRAFALLKEAPDMFTVLCICHVNPKDIQNVPDAAPNDNRSDVVGAGPSKSPAAGNNFTASFHTRGEATSGPPLFTNPFSATASAQSSTSTPTSKSTRQTQQSTQRPQAWELASVDDERAEWLDAVEKMMNFGILDYTC